MLAFSWDLFDVVLSGYSTDMKLNLSHGSATMKRVDLLYATLKAVSTP
jgi:hypothetical protein